jgi:hypothetical protein
MGVRAEKTSKNCKKLTTFSQKLTPFLKKLASFDAFLISFWHFLSTFDRVSWFMNSESKKGAEGQRHRGTKGEGKSKTVKP